MTQETESITVVGSVDKTFGVSVRNLKEERGPCKQRTGSGRWTEHRDDGRAVYVRGPG